MKTILNILFSMFFIIFTSLGYGADMTNQNEISSCQAYCNLIKQRGTCLAAERLAVKTAYGIKVCKPCVWTENTTQKLKNTIYKAKEPEGSCNSNGYEDKYGVILQKNTRGPIDGSPWECKTYCQDNQNKDDCTSAPLAIIKTDERNLKVCQACKWDKHMISKGAGTCNPTKTDTVSTYLLFEIHKNGELNSVDAMCSHVFRNIHENGKVEEITENICNIIPTKIDGTVDAQKLVWSQYMQKPQTDPNITDPNNP